MGDPRWSVPRPSTGGSDFRAAGILASVTLFIGIFSAPVWGRLADRYGRKMMVLRSCFGIAVFTALRGVSGSVWQLLALRAGMGVVAAYNASTIALVASQTPERRLGYALGWLSSGNLLGRLIGPVIGGGIADITGSYRMPFYWGGAGCFAAFVLCWIIVPERFVRPTETSRTASFASMFGVLIRSGGLLPVFLVLMLAQFGTRAVEPVVTLYVRDMLGPLPNIATLGGVAFAITGPAGIAAVPILGKRSDRIGYRRTLMISLAGAALFTLQQALPLGYGAFVAERLGLGVGVVRWRHPAGGECAGRTAGRRITSRLRLWPDRFGNVHGQLARTGHRWRDGRKLRHSMGLRGDGGVAGGKSSLGVADRAGARRSCAGRMTCR